ncbi:MAG: beta-N-acetylhexosaminidase [Bacteroidetes bacterium]|nr:beta-N-acetylhexosaminidase [Bacteroidota bacterium]
MKRLFLAIITLFQAAAFAQPAAGKKVLPLIPYPSEVKMTGDLFFLNSNTKIVLMQENLSKEISSLNEHLKKYYNFELQVISNIPNDGNYILILQKGFDTKNTSEEYELNVNNNQIQISASSEHGVFNGIQTLIQLFSIEKTADIIIPCVNIKDKPNYQWRGMHLDCSRHFFSKEEVKKYIDHLAMYKFNVFHWHLTDDQGWRIEIKKYPLLTEVGSKRKETLIGKPTFDKNGQPSKTDKYDGKPYGGFYTQEDIKEIVAYATSKHITVVPEIEMPGHSLAALAAYPQYSCTGGPFETFTRWGVSDDVYCAGKEETFHFLEDILSEVVTLFPSEYIHIGGDECVKERWKTCANCQKRIADEKLKDVNELQSYFITRMEKYINSLGKKIIGWDEILEGGLAPNAAVMSWRGTEGGIAAAKQKHFVVMTPGKPCYFDHYQSKNKAAEPLAIGGFNPIDSVYSYNPTPKILNADEAKFIMGAQGNVWTEYILTFSQVEYMSVPRMAALAETLWLEQNKKNFKEFSERLKIHSKLLDRKGVNYAKHFMAKK